MDFFDNFFTWQNIITSVVIPFLLYMISPILDRLRNIIIRLVSRMPSVIRATWRSRRAKNLNKIKKQRQNGDLVTYVSIRSHAYLILFFGSLAAFWWLTISGALQRFNEMPNTVQLIIGLPIFIFEVLWLINNEKAKTLVSYRGKLRVTSQSTSRLRRRTA